MMSGEGILYGGKGSIYSDDDDDDNLQHTAKITQYITSKFNSCSIMTRT